jgi:hypothetical protein
MIMMMMMMMIMIWTHPQSYYRSVGLVGYKQLQSAGRSLLPAVKRTKTLWFVENIRTLLWLSLAISVVRDVK